MLAELGRNDQVSQPLDFLAYVVNFNINYHDFICLFSVEAYDKESVTEETVKYFSCPLKKQLIWPEANDIESAGRENDVVELDFLTTSSISVLEISCVTLLIFKETY